MRLPDLPRTLSLGLLAALATLTPGAPSAEASPVLRPSAPQSPQRLVLLDLDLAGHGIPVFPEEGRAVVAAAASNPAVKQAVGGELVRGPSWQPALEILAASSRLRPEGPACGAPPTLAHLVAQQYPDAARASVRAQCHNDVCWLSLQTWEQSPPRPGGSGGLAGVGGMGGRPFCPPRPEGVYLAAVVDEPSEPASWLRAAAALAPIDPPCYVLGRGGAQRTEHGVWIGWPPAAIHTEEIDARWAAIDALLPAGYGGLPALVELDGSGVVSRCESSVAGLCEPLVGAPLGDEAGRGVLSFKSSRREEPGPRVTLADGTVWHGTMQPSVRATRIQEVEDCARTLASSARLRVELELDPTGRVTSVWAESTDRELGSCVSGKARAWTFPCRPEGDEPIELTFEIEPVAERSAAPGR